MTCATGSGTETVVSKRLSEVRHRLGAHLGNYGCLVETLAATPGGSSACRWSRVRLRGLDEGVVGARVVPVGAAKNPQDPFG